jgi:feruloyl esterase
MQHCAGGVGADMFGQLGTWMSDPQRNARTALEMWVEKGTAPGAIIASKTTSMDPGSSVTMTRPLCPYPQSAQYKGSGDPAHAENFACAAEKK